MVADWPEKRRDTANTVAKAGLTMVLRRV